VQAQRKHAQAGALHARRTCPHKQVQGTRTFRLYINPGFVLQDKQHSKACATRGKAQYMHTEDMPWKHPGKGTWLVDTTVAFLLQQSWSPEK